MPMLPLADMQSWIALNIACATWPSLMPQCTRQLMAPGSSACLLEGGVQALERLLPGLTERLLVIQKSHTFHAHLEGLQAANVEVIPITDHRYPPALRWVPDAPPVLYVQGTLLESDSLAVAMVGSRRPSPYGQQQAQRLSAELARHGFTVVSGLARGIDSLAHQGALQAGGRTLAVLGSGINVVYPPENRRLYEAISAGGAVLSEFPWDTKPERWNFPRRNRIISGLALGTLVVEATDRSGSLHTARHALEQGREVFAVPGRIDHPGSRGTHGLIKSGAKLVEGIDDILAEFPEGVRVFARQQCSSAAGPETAVAPADLSPQERQVLDLLPPEETHIDVLIALSRLPAHVIASILVTLELRGLIRQLPGKLFVRC